MSTVVSAAKYLRIAPICDLEIPKQSKFDDGLYNDFVQDLQFFIVQLMLEGAERSTQSAIILEGSTRQRLVALVSHLRENVQKLELPPGRIDALLARIRAFESELQNPRLRFVIVAAMTFVIAGAISDVSGATSAIRQLVNEIEETIGIAKLEQDAAAAASIAPPQENKRLEPPRKPEAPPKPPKEYRESFAADLDDEIPF